ncbi:MAG: nickel pincer cofactor biosynthesis protein LarC [Thermoguttaceae bacterium]
MQIAYLDCFSGISGDMMLGALVDAGAPLARLNDAIGSLGLPGCRLIAEEVKKLGVRATQVTVQYQPEHAHRHLGDILAMIRSGRLSARQRELAERIFTRLAEAEAKVHGIAVEKVHFHEVGAADSIADVVGTAVGWDLLGIGRAVASAVPTGTGRIRIAHGDFSVPAPATAELLLGIPLADTAIPHELTTPTGAAILATLVDAFGPPPAMTIGQIGYGAGRRDLQEQPNVLRLLLGQAMAEAAEAQICVLETNLDDASGELIGYCAGRLWEAGALDVYTTAIQMKKNRPGVKLSVLCRPADVEAMETILFEETTTLGVRRWTAGRRVLARQPHQVQTSWGPVEGKIAWLPADRARFAPEFESCRRLALEHHLPLGEVYDAARRAFDPGDLKRPPQSSQEP